MTEMNMQAAQVFVQKMVDDQDVPGLIAALQHAAVHVPMFAAKHLGDLGDRQAVEPLIKLLETSWDEATRGYAIDSLGKLGDPRAIPVIHIHAVSDDIDDRVRSIIALFRLGDKNWRLFLTPELNRRKSMSGMCWDLDQILKQAGSDPAPTEKTPAPPAPDTRGASPLVLDLIGQDIKKRAAAIDRLLKRPSRQTLDEVESAICRLVNKPALKFYKPAGFSRPSQEIYDLLLAFARSGMFFEDPLLIQSMLPKIGERNQEMLQWLAANQPAALVLYQLLGVQMQLRYQVA